MLDLLVPSNSYIFGFLQGDGHLYENSRNRGKVTVEIKYSDAHILESIQKLIPYNSTLSERTRDTNFKKNCRSACLTFCSLELRNVLKALGLPVGKKSDIVAPPETYSVVDYWRGMIDADGSLGLTGAQIPFISLNTSSIPMKESYAKYLYETTSARRVWNPNNRDNTYNMMISREEAQTMVGKLYYPGCLALDRKYDSAIDVMLWKRQQGTIKVRKMSWAPEEDCVIREKPVNEAADLLGRTVQSIKTRLWRLGVPYDVDNR